MVSVNGSSSRVRATMTWCDWGMDIHVELRCLSGKGGRINMRCPRKRSYLAVNSSKLSSLSASLLDLLGLVLKALHPTKAVAAVPDVDEWTGMRRKVCEGRNNCVDVDRTARRSNAFDDIGIGSVDRRGRTLTQGRCRKAVWCKGYRAGELVRTETSHFHG